MGMKSEIANPIGTWWIVANDDGQQFVIDGDRPMECGGGWSSVNSTYAWTSAESYVFDDCVLPKVTFEGGPIQFEIDKDLNSTWYRE